MSSQFIIYINTAILWGAVIAQGYSAGLRARWSEFRIPTRAGNFSLHRRVQTGPGAHPASYPMGTKGSLSGG
jgi:hypothetical protein